MRLAYEVGGSNWYTGENAYEFTDFDSGITDWHEWFSFGCIYFISSSAHILEEKNL